jgi:hypothetical protein
MDDVLSRPYDSDVPMGCVGDRVWASSPQGWAFRDDVHWLYLTNLKAFDIEIRDDHGLLQPAKATYYPSHVHTEGAVRAMTASASFTFTIDNVQNPLAKPFRPEKRWTCWSSKSREDWYAIDFGAKRKMDGLNVWFFDDAPSGGCRPPEGVRIERWSSDMNWIEVETTGRSPHTPAKGENKLRFDPIETDRVRLVFRNAGEGFYTGIYGFEPLEEGDGTQYSVPSTQSSATPLEITANKFITADDTLVTIIRVHNPTKETHMLYVDPILDWECSYRRYHSYSGKIPLAEGFVIGNEPRSLAAEGTKKLHDFDVQLRFRYAVIDDPVSSIQTQSSGRGSGAGFDGFSKWLLAGASPNEKVPYQSLGHVLAPNATKVFKAALELRLPEETSHIESILKPVFESDAEYDTVPAKKQDNRTPMVDHVTRYQAWFDSNLAYFDCSDPWLRKMYYHRAYVLRKNSFDPKLGHMQWKTQSEGRWRSGWYPNVISYGGGHQVREARWLRDSSYAQGHLRTFAENEKQDGVYPSHVKPAGPQGGQYTDWITSSAWDAYLVQPDREFLGSIADKLADNVHGWQKVYDPDGDGLLLVDSHWWTGMEYQPSFFFFSNYKPAKNFQEPEQQISLDRVDLTAYNFGNAVAVARIYREIGRPQDAAEFDALADRIAHAVQAKMWDSKEKFFYSLRHDDGTKANVKEVIGVYPFYFGMLPLGSPEHYEAAWASIIDPQQFWTPWPVASASKQCPAYSQTNWPGDGRAAGCMWNGPTWPHANSIVMSAMARTIRAAEAARRNAKSTPSDHEKSKPIHPLTREHLSDLFYSFTKAQFRDQDLKYPWTGEFYNGETGRWKTAERDYNHSTWLDVLIPDLLGLVPRTDDVLEIDPLLPANKLDHFLLDGQHYRGHDITLVWDAPGGADHYGDSRSGFDVYVDGKCLASAPGLARIMVNLKTGQEVQ